MDKTWITNEASGADIQWDVWNPRMKRIYDLLYPDISDKKIRSVLDLGAGQMYLKSLLPRDAAYYPVDYVKRFPETIVADFKKHQFPQQRADMVVAAGVLCFVPDTDWFFREISAHCNHTFVLSYVPVELEGDIQKREKYYLWENHYSYNELYRMLIRNGFLPVHIEKGRYDVRVEQVILVCQKKRPETLPLFAACHGCGVCAEICPAQAIEMKYDGEGFLRPEPDAGKCTDCGACLERCPAINMEHTNSPDPESCAVWASDELREQSSSGGAFSMLAAGVLEQNGSVCGAKYQPESQSIAHAVIQNISDLPPLRGSKYVQSSVWPAFSQIRQLLEREAEPVLFCGCPCQVAALKSYLGKPYGHLFTVDLLCAGVTPPKRFQQYLQENYDVSQITNVNFRTKKFGWDPYYLSISFRDGSETVVGIDQDPYEKLFHSFAGMRPSCYACAYASFPRQGDLTIGDFWGVQNFDKALDDGLGTSIVTVNSEKGRQLFDLIREKARMIRPVPWQYTGTNRLTPFLSERGKLPSVREHFFHLLQAHSFRDAVERAVNCKYDVGVICNWSGDNYGAQITQYAFYHVLVEMGKDPIMIERPNMPYPGGNAVTANLFRKNPYPSYATCPLFDELSQMRAVNQYADTFIVPSDQLWNALFAEKDLFALGYIANNKKKIAYATSFGCDPHNWSEDDRAREAFFLGQLDAVSVREDSGVRILRESFGVDGAERTLDPVFLCPRAFYEGLCAKGQYSAAGHLAAFILDPSPEKALCVRDICSRKRIDSIQISDTFGLEDKEKQWDLPTEHSVFAEDLLAVVRNSAFVLTDSFHGVCFAIIFHRPFLAIANKKRGLTRFQALLRLLHLEDRLVEDLSHVDDDLLDKPIDYVSVDAILEEERNRSLQWLADAFRMKKEADLTAYDILDEKLYQFGCGLRKWEQQFQDAWLETDGRIGGIDTELLRVNQNIDAVNSELLRINQTTDAINSELLRMNQSADVVNGELLRINQTTDGINSELLRMNQSADAVNGELLRMNQSADAVNGELLRINQATDGINTELLRMNQNADAVNGELLRINQTTDDINTELLRMNRNADILNIRLQEIADAAAGREAQLQELTQTLAETSERLARIERSFWYRLGRAITWLPRKLRTMVSK